MNLATAAFRPTFAVDNHYDSAIDLLTLTASRMLEGHRKKGFTYSAESRPFLLCCLLILDHLSASLWALQIKPVVHRRAHSVGSKKSYPPKIDACATTRHPAAARELVPAIASHTFSTDPHFQQHRLRSASCQIKRHSQRAQLACRSYCGDLPDPPQGGLSGEHPASTRPLERFFSSLDPCAERKQLSNLLL